MALFDLDAIPDAANLDEEFRLAARFWDTTLALEAESESARLEIREGRIAAATPSGSAAVTVRGRDGDWRELLAPVPRPFYQDLWGAMTHHGMTLEGEVEGVWAYYPALRRLLELLRKR